MKLNSPIAWFEIVVRDLPKAMNFYHHVFGYHLEISTCPSSEEHQISMAIFPYQEGYPGGALVSGACYSDHKAGATTTILYLTVSSIQATLDKVTAHQGVVTFPCTAIGENGYIAGFEDLDGNAIGIWSMNA